MHDGKVTRALGAEIESMALFADWMLANIRIPDQTDHVQDAVHQVALAHRRVIEAHRVWTEEGSNQGDVIAACVAFSKLVSALIH